LNLRLNEYVVIMYSNGRGSGNLHVQNIVVGSGFLNACDNL